jgi:hypothetical protein
MRAPPVKHDYMGPRFKPERPGRHQTGPCLSEQKVTTVKHAVKFFAILLASVTWLSFALPLRAEPVANARGLPPGEILILGTRHLSDIKDKYDPSILASLMDRLEQFKPDLIAVEALRGQDIAAMELQPARHAEALNPYAYALRAMGGVAQARLAINWSMAQEAVDAGIVVADDDDSRTNAVLLYLAAYDYYSALLTWHRGSDEFKAAFSEANRYIAEEFEKRLESTNEYYSMALPLAVKLGHDRLYPVDDHFDNGPMEAVVQTMPGGWDSMMAIYGDIENHPFLLEQNSRFDEAARAGDVVPYYRWLNLPETAVRDEAFQWHPLMSGDIDSRIGSARLAAWEARNLRMASHLSELMIMNPGKRVLFIVGSGHKPILDRLFSGMSWIRVVPAAEVLGNESAGSRQ